MVHQGISIQFSSLYGRPSWVRLKKQAEELGGEEPGPSSASKN
jgi:hypothetical protein